MPDPLRELVHDHRELSGLLVAIHEALQRIERGQSALDDELHELHDGVEAFREALLVHFAREQEALLPFVVARLPDIQVRADALVDEHDRLATMLTSVIGSLAQIDDRQLGSGERRAAGEESLASFRSEMTRFEQLYVAHTKSELVFLEDVATALAPDPAATEQLRRLLAES